MLGYSLFGGGGTVGGGGASERTQEVNQQLRVLEYSTPRKVHWPREVKKNPVSASSQGQ